MGKNIIGESILFSSKTSVKQVRLFFITPEMMSIGREKSFDWARKLK